MPNIRNGSKGDSNPGSLDCESGILPRYTIDNSDYSAWLQTLFLVYIIIVRGKLC